MAWHLPRPNNERARRRAALRLTFARVKVAGGFAGAPLPSGTLSAIRRDEAAKGLIFDRVLISTKGVRA